MTQASGILNLIGSAPPPDQRGGRPRKNERNKGRSRSGFLRDPAGSFAASQNDVWVSSQLISEHGLVEGVAITGSSKRGKKHDELTEIETICGLPPAEYAERTPFTQLTAINPDERFRLGDSGNVTMRIIDLIAPIGKGTRGLVVAPPKAGKTQILEALAKSIRECEPDARVITMLIDERPEEVTHFRRAVDSEVLASSNDQPIEEHIHLAELTMAHIRTELECGREIVLLIDSITRLARAFNLHGSGARRTMSGGIDAKALEIPRRLFGLARNIEHGGSVTVIATALIDTNSRMDDYIFEEFKSTGNSEVVLDRELAEARIFPAINLLASGTRKEEILYNEDEIARLTKLRRWLAGGTPKAAMNGLIKLIDQVPTNDELIQRLKP